MSKLSDIGRADLHVHTCYSANDSLLTLAELFECAEELKLGAVAITDLDAVFGFPEVWKKSRKSSVKVIFGVDAGYRNDVDEPAETGETDFRVTLLVRDETGLKNLYQLLSKASTEQTGTHPILRKRDILMHRQGLLIGSGGVYGELFVAAKRGELPKQLATFYDYVELLPAGNSKDVQAEYEQLVSWAKTHGKPFVIGSDARYLKPEDNLGRQILLGTYEKNGACSENYLWLKSAEELASDFSYLTEDDLTLALIDHPANVAGLCKRIVPFPEEQIAVPMDIERDFDLQAITYERAQQIYGDPLPEQVKERIEAELEQIEKSGSNVLFAVSHELAQYARRSGYPIAARGCLNASLVAYLAGITEINPLPPHYRCECGHYTEFAPCGPRDCGLDLIEKRCPKCGKPLTRDGYLIPNETLLGTHNHPKRAVINLSFCEEHLADVVEHLRDTLGTAHILRSGSITKVGFAAASNMLSDYMKRNEANLDEREQRRLLSSLSGVMTGPTQALSEYIIIPDSLDAEDFTPVINSANGDIPTSQFSFYDLADCLLHIDVAGAKDLSILHRLSSIKNVPIESIPVGDPAEPSILCSDSEGIRKMTEKEVEFVGESADRILEIAQPLDYDSILRASGMIHGTSNWEDNAGRLILDGTATIKEVVGTRDDVFLDLLYSGVASEEAYRIMEYVRMGKAKRYGLKDEDRALMSAIGLPDWYIDSLCRVGYLFPKAHIANRALTAFRIFWLKGRQQRSVPIAE